MNNNLLQIKIKQRLNKLASHDYDNIECWQIAEVFNKVQLEWVRRQLHGGNAYKEADGQSKRRIDDLQILLTTYPLKMTDEGVYYQSCDIPEDYLEFKRIAASAVDDCCPKRPLAVYLADESDTDVLLKDALKQPSFEWAETFGSLFGNTVRIYTNGSFEVVDPSLVYFRKPRSVEFKDCQNPNTGASFSADVTCEFKDDIVEILIDETAAVLAADIESQFQYQVRTAQAEKNN